MALVEDCLVDTAPSQLPSLRNPPQGSPCIASRGTSRSGSRGGCSRRRAARTSPQCQRWWDVDVCAGGFFDTTALRPADFVQQRPSTVPARPCQQRHQGLAFPAGPLATKALVTNTCDDSDVVLGNMQTLESNSPADTCRGPSYKLKSGQGRLEQNTMQSFEPSDAEVNTAAAPAGFTVAPSTVKTPSLAKPETAPTAWCGRCKALPYCDNKRAVPSAAKYVNQKNSYFEVLKNQDSVPERLSHWPGDVGDVHLPSTPVESVFSQRPHPRFPGLSIGDMARLDVQLLQCKVKAPMQIKFMDDDSTVQSTIRQRLEAETVRMVMRKSAALRSRDEIRVVMMFLQRCKFFMELPEMVIRELLPSLFLRTYDADTTIVRRSEKTQSIMLILKGTVLTQETLNPKRYSAGDLLGFPEDPNVLDWKEAQVWEGREYSSTIVSDTTGAVDALCLSVDHLILTLQAQSVKDRIEAMKLFGPTKTRPPAEFSKASRVFRNGNKVPLYDLFAIKTVSQQFRFFQEGMVASSQSEIMMVLSGEVHLKLRGVALQSLTVGEMLGEEPLSSMPYQCSAECASITARLLSISVADYVTHFLQGCLPEPTHTSSPSMYGTDVAGAAARAGDSVAGLVRSAKASVLCRQLNRRRSLHANAALRSIAAGHPFQNSVGSDKLDALVESVVGPGRRCQDRCSLVESEWQTLRNKEPMSIAPAGLRTQSARTVRPAAARSPAPAAATAQKSSDNQR